MPLDEAPREESSHIKLEYHATVKELPGDERPRERLQHFGPQALSLAELLAIVLRTGSRGDNALELANRLLARYSGLLVRRFCRIVFRARHGGGKGSAGQGSPGDRATTRPACA